MFNEDVVKHCAKLARIKLNDKDVKKFSLQLSDVLTYMDVLNEVDTSNVLETSQVTGLTNITGEDEIKLSECKREDLLSSSELPIDSKQVRVLKVIQS